MGHSPTHTGNVALFLNLQTGHVSPQYHVVFDDEFTNVPYVQSTEAPPNWADLVANHTENATDEAFTIYSLWYEGEEAARLSATENEQSTEEYKLDINPDLMMEEEKPFINLDTIVLRGSTRIKDILHKKVNARFLIYT